MTLEEKLAQLGSYWAHDLLDRDQYDPARVQTYLRFGIGHVTRVSGDTNLGRREAAKVANQLQRFLVEETRLGIPAIVHEECLHGVLAPEAVCFPQSIGLAATFDPSLVEEMAARIGRELRAVGAHQGLAPILDITRDPRWGRVEETYGEDPYLVTEIGCAYIRGLQGDGEPQDRIVATGKHMTGHGLPEGGLNHAPAHIGPRELADFFLLPFEAAFRETGLRSVMNAYDEVDGVPCICSRELFTEILRDRWQFDGTVVSDYAAIDELISSHAVTTDRSEAAALSLEAGIDVELPSHKFFAAPLAEAIQAGRVAIAVVDRAVERVLRTKFELGLFEHPYVDEEAADPPLDSDRAFARELGRQSMVLLVNDGVLPLGAGLRRIAVVGPNADSARNLLGDYSFRVHEESSARGLAGMQAWRPRELPEYVGRGTVLDAIRERAGSSVEIAYAAGSGLLDGSDAQIAAAVEAARGADVAILVLGDRSGLTDDCTCGESRDRLSLDLPGRQGELFWAVAGTGTPIVLVLLTGRPLAIPREAAASSAVLAAWVPGEEGGRALADVLFGDAAPGGKLPITVPYDAGQVPIYYGHKPSGGRSHEAGSYVDGTNLPLWPFGFGLSYTRFEVGDMRLESAEVPVVGGWLRPSVEVRNIGDRAGDEVVQLYLRDLEASVTRPVAELRGLKRVHLEPGKSCRVEFEVSTEEMSFTGLDGRARIEPGAMSVAVGTSCVDLPCRADFRLTGEARVLTDRRHYLSRVAVREAQAPREA